MTDKEEMVERREGDKKQKDQMNALLWIIGIGMLIMLTLTTVLSTASLIISHTVKSNSDKIAITAMRVEQVEQKDRDALRGASYRTCEREQRDRAEQHLRASLSPPGLIVKLVKTLGLPKELANKVSIEEVRLRLPIFDCTPNLAGGQAISLTPRAQEEYVKEYSEGKLDPTP